MEEQFRNISIAEYTYELPPERIAMHPLQQRDLSNLLVYRHGQIEKGIFRHIDQYLPASSLMVFNNTRVVQARLLFQKESGATIEIFCLEPAGAVKDVQLAFAEKGQSTWFCMVGNAKKWKQGSLTAKVGEQGILRAHKLEKSKDGYTILFEWEGDMSFAEILDVAGKTPLPPYIGRKAEEEDKTRYQTIYARHSGSVAAPTAGLHFTDRVMQQLALRNIKTTQLTLHVGAGTFKPVSSSTIGDHHMHQEQIIVSRQTIESLLAHADGNIVSVGTTSLRTLESLYWLGAKIIKGYAIPEDGFHIQQWEPYRYSVLLPAVEQSMAAIVNYMKEKDIETLHGETSLIIVPGYRVRMARMLVTNFHQPGSTLLLLVAAFCGNDWQKIYQFALDNDFRFLSYGDSCLMFRNDAQEYQNGI